MSDITQLENELLAAIASAKDEAGLEAVRVAALGKSGSVSALLKTLGAMMPDERKVQGPAINGLKERVTAAIVARKDTLAAAAAHPHFAGAGEHQVDAEAADPRHHAGPHLSQRQRPDPHADVPPGRGLGDRQGLASRPPEVDSRGILQGVLRGRQREDAFPPVVLPVH